MTPAEREGPSEAAVRDQLREEPGPRASSSPADGRRTAREDGAGGRAVTGADAADGGSSTERGEGDPGRDTARAVDATPGTTAPPEAPSPASEDRAETPAVEDVPGQSPPVADPLADAERQRDEYLTLAQRTQADFENFRRRAARDAAAAGARAKAGLVRELLPAIDNLERALAASDHADDGFARGVQMVHGELIGALERNGVAAFEPTGEPFDPTVHEAISTRPVDGTEPGVVLDVVEKGYRLDETVLRPARVVVSA